MAPESTAAFVELAHPEALLDVRLDPATEELLKGVEGYQRYLQSPQNAQLQMARQVAEAKLGTSWQMAVRDLFGGVGLAADASNQALLLFIRARKPELLTRLNNFQCR